MEVLSYNLVGKYAVKVSSQDISLSWRKFCARVADASSYCSYEANPEGELSLFDYKTSSVQTVEKEEWSATRPVFFETNSYAFTIHFYDLKEGTKPSIVHPDSRVKEMFNFERSGNEAFLTGAINYLNEPGTFSLQFIYETNDGEKHDDHLTFDVVSPKLDTKHDLNIIIQQIKSEYDDLVFRYLSLTFHQFEKGKEANNDLIWLSVFKDVIDNYIRALRYIIHRPHMKYVRTSEFGKAERIKRWDNELVEKFINDRETNEEKALKKFYQYTLTQPTENTRENRFVKFTITRIKERLDGVMSKISDISEGKVSGEEKAFLNEKSKELDLIKSSSLFRTVGRFEGFRQESLILQQRTGYAQVYRYWIMLQNGLDLIDGKTSVGVLPVWQLYEVWCYLKLKRLVCKVLGLNPANPKDHIFIHENKDTMFNPFAETRLSDTVKYDNPENGDVVELGYQYSYDLNSDRDDMRSMTVKQEPDIVLNIHKKDTGSVLTYLFDAKYRVLGDDDPNSSDSIADSPVPDTLNQMHRYRDAIYYGKKKNRDLAKEVIGAYILFPGRLSNESKMVDDMEKGNFTNLPNYLKSILDVNIGAFPLLPNENSGILLENHLQKLIKGQIEIEHLTDSTPQRGLNYTIIPNQNSDVILLGCVRSDQQLKWIKTHGWYNIRLLVKGHERAGAQSNDINLMLVKEVILYQFKEDNISIIGSYGMKSLNLAPMFFDYADMQKSGYPNDGNSDSFSRYLVYEIDMKKDIPIDEELTAGITNKIQDQPLDEKGAPIIVRREELK